MASLQRLRGSTIATVYQTREIIDDRGNKTIQPVAEGAYTIRVSITPDRSARAEVPGEMEIDVINIRVPHMLPGITIRSRVYLGGSWWDLVSPPAHRVGTRHTRHTTLTLRRRPGGGGIVG